MGQGQTSTLNYDLAEVCAKVRPRWWQDTHERTLLGEALLCAVKENA